MRGRMIWMYSLQTEGFGTTTHMPILTGTCDLLMKLKIEMIFGHFNSPI